MEKRLRVKKLEFGGFGLTGQSALIFLSSEVLNVWCLMINLCLNQTQLIKQHKALAVDACYKQQFLRPMSLFLSVLVFPLESWFEKIPQ